MENCFCFFYKKTIIDFRSLFVFHANCIFFSIFSNLKLFLICFISDLLQFPTLPNISVPLKMPKFKKIRQWSHDSIANLTQLTNRTNSNEKQHKQQPSTGITTISSAIHEQQIDPKKDNFGLYALKCDRSKSLANAKRGILLTLPSTTKIKATKIDFHSIERNHEIFKSCETLEHEHHPNDFDDNPRKLDGMSQQTTKVKIEPPPRRKKKKLITAIHQKKTKQLQQVNRAGHGTITAMETLERNDSGLYKIVASTETAKITYVEPREHHHYEHLRKEKSVAIVKPKIEKAVIVKAAAAMPKQIGKVKDYGHQRKQPTQQQHQPPPPVRGNLKKMEMGKKKYVQSMGSIESKKSNDSVDIFKSNRQIDQKKLFDEFDELFEKNKALTAAAANDNNDDEIKEVIDQSPANAFMKLNELKNHSIEKSPPTHNESLIPIPIDIKPKIISEHAKQHINANVKKKILYYDDASELQEELKLKRTTSEMKSSTKLLKMDVKDYETKGEIADLNENQTSIDYKHPSQLISTATSASTTTTLNASKSNSLRIFSNEGIFVFNL